jgi:hypothetical protein
VYESEEYDPEESKEKATQANKRLIHETMTKIHKKLKKAIINQDS